MSSVLSFPYSIALREGGVVDVVPVAEVTFRNAAREWLSLFLIIDSGAALSALPAADAIPLGVDLEKGAKMMVGGIGGEFTPGWRHELTIRLGGEQLCIPFVFLEREVTPRILGRAGVFEKFIVVFEEKRRRCGFAQERTREAQAIQQFFDVSEWQ